MEKLVHYEELLKEFTYTTAISIILFSTFFIEQFLAYALNEVAHQKLLKKLHDYIKGYF